MGETAGHETRLESAKQPCYVYPASYLVPRV